MGRLKSILFVYFILILSACAGVDSTDLTDTGSTEASPYAGKYVGKEVLDGGTFVINIIVSAGGKVTVIDIDGRKAKGQLEGASFVAVRTGIPQVFSGKISGNEITGHTKGNPYLGGGTFSAILQ